MMDKTSKAAAGLINHELRVAAMAIAAVAILAPLPLPAYAAFHKVKQPPLRPKPPSKELNDALKNCSITDPNGRKWPCSRVNNPAVNHTLFECPIENRLGVEMRLYCDNWQWGEFIVVAPGETAMDDEIYPSVYDPAPMKWTYDVDRKTPNVTCEWQCAGNTMKGVVVWNEQWPEAWSCRAGGGDGRCRIVFDSNREVVLDTKAGRRVLGDLAIKECSKNLWGYGGWLPFGLGCTYPKHDHPYYGSIA